MENFKTQLDVIESELKKAHVNQTEKINNLEEEVNNMHKYFSDPNFITTNTNIDQNGEMDDFIRKGIIHPDEQKSFSGSADEAGSIIKPSMHKKILSFMKEKSPMRKIASIDTISTGAIDYVIEDGEMATGWVGEKEARGNTDTSKLVSKRISVHELYAQPKATQRLIDDAEVNIESWLAERLAESFVKAENISFFKGDGNKKPKGLLTNNDIKKIDTGDTVTVDTIMRLMTELPEHYVSGAHFLMNRKTLSQVQSLKDDQGRFIWQHSMSDPLAQTIFGVPVICTPEMPDIANDSLSIAIGDFSSAYKIVDRSHINIMRDPYTEKPYVKFYATKRVGGDVLNPDAIRFAKFVV